MEDSFIQTIRITAGNESLLCHMQMDLLSIRSLVSSRDSV